MSYTNANAFGFEEAERSPLVLVDIRTLRSIIGDVVDKAIQYEKGRGTPRLRTVGHGRNIESVEGFKGYHPQLEKEWHHKKP